MFSQGQRDEAINSLKEASSIIEDKLQSLIIYSQL